MRILGVAIAVVVLAGMLMPLAFVAPGPAAATPEPSRSFGSVGGSCGHCASPSALDAIVLGRGVAANSTGLDHRPPLTYTVVFAESGLPTGTNWSVTLTGSTSSTILGTFAENSSRALTRWSNGAPTVVFRVSNGSYFYSMGTEGTPGWNSIAGQVAVNGPLAESISVSFWSSTTVHHRLSMVGYATLAGLVALVGAVIAGVVLWFLRRPRGAGPLRASQDEPDPLAVQERDS